MKIIAGVDEVGRGSLIGPVYAAAVILNKSINKKLLKDSKSLKKSRREILSKYIKKNSIWAIGRASIKEIEKNNILNASLLAMRRAIKKLKKKPTLILVDGNKVPIIENYNLRSIIKGDQKIPSISAASIIAKVARDKMITKIGKKFKAEVPFVRPKYLSTDKASSVSALKHAVKWAENEAGFKYDIIIELMCTNPFKNSKDIDSVIKKILKSKADSVIAVHKIEDHHPARIKRIVNDRIKNFCVKEKAESRRQDLKPFAYVRSGSIYALKRDFLMNKNLRYGSYNSRPYILPANRAINIDNEIDFYLADKLMKNNAKK